MSRDVKLYVSDILDNMKAAQEFAAAMNAESLSTDRKTAYAVVRCLEIIGEAAKNVPEDLRAQSPQIPWRDLAGMRDKCIHMYFGVNLSRVIAAVKQDIPTILPHVQSLLEKIADRPTHCLTDPAINDRR